MRSLFASFMLVSALLSGCSSLIKGMVYPLTEHARCIEKCKDQYRSSRDAYMDATCRQRCDREFGAEESRRD